MLRTCLSERTFLTLPSSPAARGLCVPRCSWPSLGPELLLSCPTEHGALPSLSLWLSHQPARLGNFLRDHFSRQKQSPGLRNIAPGRCKCMFLIYSCTLGELRIPALESDKPGPKSWFSVSRDHPGRRELVFSRTLSSPIKLGTQ